MTGTRKNRAGMRVTGTRPVTRGNPTNLLISTLQGLTSAAQAPFVSVAEFLGLETQQFWGSNIILVKNLTPSKLSSLAATPGDFIIRKQHTAYVDSIVEGHEFQTLNSTQNPSWGIARIRASDAWAVTNGTGIVVGIIDTGVNVGHEALAGGYAGAWSDPWYGTDGPTDTHGHGTHCAGTILGRANGIGVAPGATWVACRGLNDQAGAVETTLTHCAEWMLGANPRPHIVSNSWVYSSGVNWYNPQIAAWRNAGITPVFVLGNAGPACGTAQSPGDQENVISFGATTDTDAVASFSSRGPTPHGQIKPDFSAPGILIVSAGTGSDNYVSMSGTSMATLHAAGAVALIRAANPDWSFEQTWDSLNAGAAAPPMTNTDRVCGLPFFPSDFPNYTFGFGRIDVAASLGV